MTASAFEQIPIGMSTTELDGQVGAPYRIASKEGWQQYYYLERIQTGPSSHAQNTYILTIKDGEIVDKQCLNESQSLNFQIR
jgi:hypothetical protein